MRQKDIPEPTQLLEPPDQIWGSRFFTSAIALNPPNLTMPKPIGVPAGFYLQPNPITFKAARRMTAYRPAVGLFVKLLHLPSPPPWRFGMIRTGSLQDVTISPKVADGPQRS